MEGLYTMKRLTTKEYIAITFEELLKENNFESISVQDIAQACNISRTTFYRHFEDKYSLTNWIYLQNKNAFIAQNNAVTSWKELSLAIYSFVYNKKDFFRKALDYNGQNSLYEFIYLSSYSFFTNLLKEILHVDTLPDDLDYSVRLYCGGANHTFKEWLMNGAKETPELMTKYACDNMPSLMQKYIK